MAGKKEGVAADENDVLLDWTSNLRSRIRVSFVFLCENSTNLHRVVDHLVSNSLLSQDESEVIENKDSSYGRFRQLFAFITPRLDHGNNSQHFVNAFQLSGNEHILEKLKSAVVTTDPPRHPDTSSQRVRIRVREQLSSVRPLSRGLLRQRESEVIENRESNYDSFRQLFTFLIPKVGHGDNSQHFVNAFQQSDNEHILKERKSTSVTKDFAPKSADTSSLKRQMAEIGGGAAADENDTFVDWTSDLGSRIRVSLVFLCENSTNLNGVLLHLLSHDLLSQRESEIVESEKAYFDSFRKLFTFLIPRLGHRNNAQHFVNAFQRSGNQHILEEMKSVVVSAYPSVRFNVREPVVFFVGRKQFIRDLHQRNLQHLQSPTILSRICVVTGIGGIGKTETIRKYIHSYGSFYHHVVWIDAEEHRNAENQFRRIALELQLPSKDVENKAKDFDVILKDVYDRLCSSNTLLVLDNAEAIYDSDPQRQGVRRFLPTSLPPNFIKPVIIITSRKLDWPDLQPMPLPLFTSQESSEFLFRQLKLEVRDATAEDAETLSETFGGLPLALHTAIAFIRQESRRKELVGKDVYSIRHLFSDYNQGKREVLEKYPPGSPDTIPLVVLRKVSLDKIRQQPNGHLATEILEVMAHLSPANIPKDLIFFIFNSNEEQSLMDAVELLADYSFVHNSRNHFSIDRMLQDVRLAHLEASTEEHSQNWFMSLRIWTFLTSNRRPSSTLPLIRITTALKKYWPTVPKSSEAFDAVHDNLVHVTMSHVLPRAENQSETDFHFIEFIEFVLEEIIDTRLVEAEKCCRVLITYFTSSVVSLNSLLFQSSFKKVRYLRRKLTWILQRMGRYKEAVDICQELLSSFNSLEDRKDVISDILDTKHYLAMILESQGDYKEAIKSCSIVLDHRSKLHGPNHPYTLDTKNNLAVALQNSGRLSEAKTLYAEILEMRMEFLGPLHPSIVITKYNMALILAEEGHYDDALKMMREVLKVKQKKLGPFHVDTFISKSCIANVLQKQGKDEDAQQLYANVISCYEKASAASNLVCLLAKNNLAIILGKQGRVDEANEMLCIVLDAKERLLGPSHTSTLTTKHNLAWVLEKQGKHADALKLYEEVLELRKKLLGPMHPKTLRTSNSIGWLHLEIGDFQKAENIAKEVLATRQATLPSDHPDYKDTEALYERARLRNDTFTIV